MKKLCLDCGSVLIGRSDKKFCSDYCRNNFHNRQNQTTNNYIRRVNYALRKNRRILQKLNQRGLGKVEKSRLMGEGFIFEYITHMVQDGEGHRLYFCYDQGYRYLTTDLLGLINREDKNRAT
jgi:hypothetical protein